MDFEKMVDNISENLVQVDSNKIEDNKDRLQTRNEHLEGKTHPETGIKYEKKEVVLDNGEVKEGVFPEFEVIYDVKLDEKDYKESDRTQFKIANGELKEEIKKNPELKDKFTEQELEQIENGKTPEGYVWHHSEETGKLELVDKETHAKTGHTGGRVIWGGGNINR